MLAEPAARKNEIPGLPAAVKLADVIAARERIAPSIYRSPCPRSYMLSRLCGCEIYCKLDHLQMTGSFKERGARNKLLLLTPDEKKVGVIAASAGNHALGLAYHGRDLGVPVTVVMPRWTPLIKIKNCRSLGATVLLHGQNYDESRQEALRLSESEHQTYIPGFDDPDIIAGQGTVALEILEDVPDVDAIIVPVGGAGLIAGIGLVVKSLRPQTRIIGVEPENAVSLYESLRAGKVVRVQTKPTLADGLAVAEVGKLCFEISRQVVDEVVMVDESHIAHAVLRLLELEKTVVEGAGAASLAAAMHLPLGLEGKKVVLLLCGGNIDVSVISRVIERGLAADGRLCRLVASVDDRPGSLARVTAVLASTGASVKEIWHDRHFAPADVGRVNVVCLLETRDAEHIAQVHHSLREAGIVFTAD
jgi:threonine dehydratase